MRAFTPDFFFHQKNAEISLENALVGCELVYALYG
jgi:hypothetical protein